MVEVGAATACHPMRVPRTYRYGSDPSQVADLHLPEGGGPWPVAVVIHGGFWRARYDRTLMDAVCADLAVRGWAAWNLEYRRIGPAAPAAGRRRSTTWAPASTNWHPSMRQLTCDAS